MHLTLGWWGGQRRHWGCDLVEEFLARFWRGEERVALQCKRAGSFTSHPCKGQLFERWLKGSDEAIHNAQVVKAGRRERIKVPALYANMELAYLAPPLHCTRAAAKSEEWTEVKKSCRVNRDKTKFMKLV